MQIDGGCEARDPDDGVAAAAVARASLFLRVLFEASLNERRVPQRTLRVMGARPLLKTRRRRCVQEDRGSVRVKPPRRLVAV